MHPNGVSLSQKNPLLQNEPNFKIKPIKPKLNRFFKMQPYATLDLGCLTSSSSSLRSAKVIQAYSRSFKAIQALKKIVIFLSAPKCQRRRARLGVVPLLGAPKQLRRRLRDEDRSRPSKTTKNHEKPNNLRQTLHNDPFASPCKIAYNVRLGAGFIRNPSPSEKSLNHNRRCQSIA
jgi:hypothetical protein